MQKIVPAVDTDESNTLVTLIAIRAILNNQTLLQDKNMTSADVEALLSMLLEIASLKPFFGPVSFEILCEALYTLPDRLISHNLQTYFVQKLKEDEVLLATPSAASVLIAIRLRNNFDNRLIAKFKKLETKHGKWANVNPLSKESYCQLENCIKKARKVIRGPSIKQLSGLSDLSEPNTWEAVKWRERPHFLYTFIARAYKSAKSDTSKESRDLIPFSDVWGFVSGNFEQREIEFCLWTIAMVAAEVHLSYLSDILDKNSAYLLYQRGSDDRALTLSKRRIALTIIQKCENSSENSLLVCDTICSCAEVAHELFSGTLLQFAKCLSTMNENNLEATVKILRKHCWQSKNIHERRILAFEIANELLYYSRERTYESDQWRRSIIALLLECSILFPVNPEMEKLQDLANDRKLFVPKFEATLGRMTQNQSNATFIDSSGHLVTYPALVLNTIDSLLEATQYEWRLQPGVNEKRIIKSAQFVHGIQSLVSWLYHEH